MGWKGWYWLVVGGSGRVVSLRKINFQNCQKILKTTPIMYKNKVGNTYYLCFLTETASIFFIVKW